MKHAPLPPYRQGFLWRQAGGSLLHCWHKEGSADRKAFERGFKEADAEMSACQEFWRLFGYLPSKEELTKFRQATDNKTVGEGESS